MAGSRFEPDINDIGFLGEPGCAAVRAFSVLRNESLGGRRIPGVSPVSRKQLDNSAIQFWLVERLAATLAKKDGNWYAPDALARNAPVGTSSDHVGDSLLTPGRIPFYFFDSVERDGAQCSAFVRGFHRDVPLIVG